MDKNKNTHLDTLLFEEESKRLQEVYRVLVLKENKFKEYLRDIDETLSVYSDPYERRELIREKNSRQRELELIRKIKEEPYFLRVDYKPIDDFYAPIETVYIGKELIQEGPKRIVFNWQSQIYEAAMLQNFYEFQDPYLNQNEPQEFHLKRDINCTQQLLISYFDQYSKKTGLVINNEKIVDPFLISVLERKRNNPAITDIISTIQRDQFDLMIRPLYDNFVVQGCAGSGKTMILLHRVSFQLYRNNDLKNNQFWVITPNNIFLKQIESLRNDLKIESVPTFTILTFYQELYKLYGFNTQISDSIIFSRDSRDILGNKNEPKTTLQSNFDVLLFEEDQVALNFLMDVFDKEKNLKKVKKSVEVIYRFLIDISASFNQTELQIEEYYKLSNAQKSFDKRKNEVFTLINNQISNLRKSTKNLSNVEQHFWKFSTLLMSLVELSQDQLHSESSMNLTGKKILKNFYEFQTYGEDLSPELIFPILVKLYKWNMFLQSIQKKQIKHTKLPQLFTRDEIVLVHKKIKNSLKQMLEIESNITNIQYLETAKELLLVEPIEKFEQFFQHFHSYQDIVVDLYKQDEISSQVNQKIDEFRFTHTLAYKIIENGLISVFESSKEFIRKFQDKYLNPSYVSDQYFEIILKTKFNSNFRDHLFLKLSIISIMKGNLSKNVKQGVLFFDEAQDIHPSEYRLFKAILPEFAINAYGDIQQSIISEVSVKNWKNIDYSIEVVELNQNYRNSVEITEFVNETLGMNMQSIGINDAKVHVDTLDNLKRIVHDSIAELSKKRIAIISNSWYTNQNDLISILGSEQYLSFNKVEVGKICILSVMEAKGLEFEKVIVIEEGLNKKELYVSYTRALKNLIVIR